MATQFQLQQQTQHEYHPLKPTGSSTTSRHDDDSSQHEYPTKLSAKMINENSSLLDAPNYRISYVTRTQLQSLIVKASRTAESRFGSDPDSISRFVLKEVGAYLLDVNMADKRLEHAFQTTIGKHKYFSITNLFTNIESTKTVQTQSKRIVNEIFAGLGSNIESIHKAKEIDLQTGFPILSWFLDMYSRDRISNAFNITQHSRRYDLNTWFNKNLFARY
eukprot:731368_1